LALNRDEEQNFGEGTQCRGSWPEEMLLYGAALSLYSGHELTLKKIYKEIQKQF